MSVYLNTAVSDKPTVMDGEDDKTDEDDQPR